MPIRLTKRGTPMVESCSLQLAFASHRLNRAIIERVSARLTEMGYAAATPATLDFLGALECGENHASELARMMGVSRQAVAKSVRQFCHLGYLEQSSGPGRQKRILFTQHGEQLIADARRVLATLDKQLGARIGAAALADLLTATESVADAVEAIENHGD